MRERVFIGDGIARYHLATTRPPPANPEPRDERARAPITPAVCCCCGEPAGRLGCLVALAYIGALHVHRWCHRSCGEQAGLIVRDASTTVRRLKVPRRSKRY
jgi:hypothetical protein